MSVTGEGSTEDWQIVQRWSTGESDGGFAWIASPEEDMQRASTALAIDGDVWVLDPVDAPGLDDRLAELGTVAGVALLLDRHKRDAASVANRHDVPVFLPEWFEGVESALDAPVERFAEELPGTGFETITIVDNRFWQEVALFDGETLVVPEAVGSTPYMTAGGARLGVHPILRLRPPRSALGGIAPERVVVGHGRGVAEDAAAALSEALSTARRGAPRVLASMVSGLVRR